MASLSSRLTGSLNLDALIASRSGVGPLGRGAVQEAARSLEAILHSVVIPNPRRNQAAPRPMNFGTTASLRLLKNKSLILWFAPISRRRSTGASFKTQRQSREGIDEGAFRTSRREKRFRFARALPRFICSVI